MPPYPNEHSCRLRDPGDFQADSFRRISRKHEGKTYGVIVGRLKGKTTTAEQAYRYAKDDWSASEARTHCKDHDGTFEAATGAKAEEPASEERAVWTTKYINDLPDSAFLYVEPGGKKDEDGKTVPRSLRHFPYRDASGKIDLPHLRNALARIPQSKLPQAVKDRLIAKARKLLDDATGKKAEELDETERRIIVTDDAELRVTDDEHPKIVGYAAKYGSVADLGCFTEKIRTGAFDEVLKTSDARALKNHDPSLLLGRESSGTLQLTSNTVGLRFEIKAPDTTTGRDTIEEVRRGDLAGCSFAFQVAEDDWKHLEDGRTERTIIKVGKLFDVGPVTYPAYPDTTVAVRSLEAFQAARAEAPSDEGTSPPEDDEIQNQTEDKPETISAERRREIERGYRKAERIINRCRRAIERSRSPEQ